VSVSLTLDQVKERARRAPMVPIFRDMLSDALTPVTAYAALAADGPSYLLESVERGEQLGRYSFVAADPMAIVTIAGGRATVQDASGRRELEGADPLRALEAYLQTFVAEPAEGLPEGFCGGAVGYLGYEAAGYLERLPLPEADPLQVPDGVTVRHRHMRDPDLGVGIVLRAARRQERVRGRYELRLHKQIGKRGVRHIGGLRRQRKLRV